MSAKIRTEGAFILWPWGNKEIEEPKRLRNQLLEIAELNFSGVLASLNETRYEFIDPAVLRALAQASQWAKARNIAFWFHADPRQASRSFIAQTGERMQNLLTVQNVKKEKDRSQPNMTRVKENRFELHYAFPGILESPVLQENAVLFEPVGLERAFLFQKDNGTIIRDTLRDITPYSRFHADIASGRVSVFGNVRVPSREEWWVIAFPKFNTNTYDFSGRENADMLGNFVENVFDACTHLSGITWGDGGGGYLADRGRLPVSLSLYNTFKAEYGYDLRDVLYALTHDTDDNSHIHIRRDYHSLLVETITNAQTDFHRMVHSYFNDVCVGQHHTSTGGTIQAADFFRGTCNPWENASINVFFTDVQCRKVQDLSIASLLPKLIMAKSLGFLASAQRGFFSYTCEGLSPKERRHVFDLFSLYSLEWLVRLPNYDDLIIEGIKKKEWENLLEANEKIYKIRKITGYQFPEANVAVIYPNETLITAKPQDAELMIRDIDNIIAGLVRRNLQIDVLSSTLLERGRLTPNGFIIRGQLYESIIFPYPAVLSQRNLEIISILDKRGFKLCLGGCEPRYTDKDKTIPHTFKLSFHPGFKKPSLMLESIKPLFEYPDNALATTIKLEDSELFLICPIKAGEIVKGEIQTAGETIVLPESNQLMILRKDNNGGIEQLM